MELGWGILEDDKLTMSQWGNMVLKEAALVGYRQCEVYFENQIKCTQTLNFLLLSAVAGPWGSVWGFMLENRTSGSLERRPQQLWKMRISIFTEEGCCPDGKRSEHGQLTTITHRNTKTLQQGT